MSKSKDETKRRRILHAASKIFGKKTFNASKISEIAKEAEVADGTIYLYFKNKNDLLSAVFDYNMDHLIPLMHEALKKTNDPLEKIHSFIQLHLKYIGEHNDLSRVFQVELHESQPRLHENNNSKFQEYLEILTETLQEGQEQGQLRSNISNDFIKRVLFGAMSELAIHWNLNRETSPPLPESADLVYQIIIDGLKYNHVLEKGALPEQQSLSAA